MNANPLLRFRYKISTAEVLRVFLIAFALTAVFAYWSVNTPDALITRKLELLSPDAPVLFFRGTAFFCLFAALFTLRLTVAARRSSGYVELGPACIVAPGAAASTASVSIPYAAIRRIRAVPKGKDYCVVISSDVVEARLLSRYFASSDDFKLFLLSLERRRLACKIR